MPPEEWKNTAAKIKAEYKAKGYDDKKAEQIGFAISTKIYERKHGVNPMTDRVRLRPKK